MRVVDWEHERETSQFCPRPVQPTNSIYKQKLPSIYTDTHTESSPTPHRDAQTRKDNPTLPWRGAV